MPQQAARARLSAAVACQSRCSRRSKRLRRSGCKQRQPAQGARSRRDRSQAGKSNAAGLVPSPPRHSLNHGLDQPAHRLATAAHPAGSSVPTRGSGWKPAVAWCSATACPRCRGQVATVAPTANAAPCNRHWGWSLLPTPAGQRLGSTAAAIGRDRRENGPVAAKAQGTSSLSSSQRSSAAAMRSNRSASSWARLSRWRWSSSGGRASRSSSC